MIDSILSVTLALFAAVMPVSIAFANIAGAPLLLFWFVGRKGSPLLQLSSWGAVEWFWAVFMGFSFVSAWMGLNFGQSRYTMWKKDFYFLLALALPSLVKRPSDLWSMVRWFVIAGVVMAVFGLLQAAIGVDQTDIHGGLFNRLPERLENWPRPILDILSLVNGRVRGTRSHPIHYAACLLFTLSFCISFLMSERKPSRVWIWIGSTAVLASAVLLSYSRGPWIGLGVIVALAVGFAFLRHQGRRTVRLLIFVIPIAGFLMLLPDLRQRATSMVDKRYASNEERLHMWRVGWTLWKLDPMLGIGAGNVKTASFPFLNEEESIGGGWGHLHNSYINLAVERGALGLLAYLGLLGALMIEIWRAMRRVMPDSREADLYQSALLGMIGFLICGFTETVYNASVVSMMFWFTAGLALAASRARDT